MRVSEFQGRGVRDYFKMEDHNRIDWIVRSRASRTSMNTIPVVPQAPKFPSRERCKVPKVPTMK